MNEAFSAPDDNDGLNNVCSTAGENGGHVNNRNSSIYAEVDEVAMRNSGLLNVCLYLSHFLYSAGNSDFVPKSVCTRGENA